jgi:serine/threonine-protein kinase RsbW
MRTVTGATRPESADPVAAGCVTLDIPADRSYVVLARSTAGHLGARIGLSMQELGDLRLAVDEACGLLLLPGEFKVTGESLRCQFEQTGDALQVTVSAGSPDGSGPDLEGFGWNLLAALVDDLRWTNQLGRAGVHLAKRPAGQ